MTTEQVIDEILSMVKPYAHVGLKQSMFSNAIKAIRAGTYKEAKKVAFFKLFGFNKGEDQWSK